MEWIVFGFMGTLGLVVALLMGFIVYSLYWGKAKDLPTGGPSMGNHSGPPTNPHDNFPM